MGTNCVPLAADLFLFCYETDFMLFLSDNNQADVIEAFNSTSRYLDDLLNLFQGGTSFVDHLCYLCLVFAMLSHLFIAALWSSEGKGLSQDPT